MLDMESCTADLPPNWRDDEVPCVVLCGGKGSRLQPTSIDTPKALIEINGEPLLARAVEFWRPLVSEFIFVVHHQKEKVIEYISSIDAPTYWVECTAPRGIATGVAAARPLVENRFIVVLGDCLYQGRFIWPPRMEQGIGIWHTHNFDQIRQNYSVEVRNRFIRRVEEKPIHLPNNICGMGVYFFTLAVFNYIEATPPSALRNEVEITDVIQRMIEKGEEVTPVFFEGFYININRPEDLEEAARLFVEGTPPRPLDS